MSKMMERQEDYKILLKTVFVGDTQVGKTSLFTRETDNVFNK
jgi:GTPase SAR1 family protein